MQILHRISFSATPELQRELASLGISTDASGFAVFEVDEAQDTWPAIQRWVVRNQALDIVSTKFSKKELAEARWLALVPDWHHGYPQPRQDSFGYREATYDVAAHCQKCGMGLRQRAPFQMKGEPKWGRNGILQLHWVFDEFFVTPEVWTQVFQPHGVGRRPVLNTKGAELETVVQLVAEEEVSLVTDGLASETCASCGRVKYLPVTRGAFPAFVQPPSSQLAKTRESFGSGASAHRGVVLSQALGRALTDAKVRGASLKPVHEPGR